MGNCIDRFHFTPHTCVCTRRYSSRSRGIAASIRFSSMFSVSSRTSKTGVAPRRTNAIGSQRKLYDGMITSSPACMSRRRAAISSAAVQEWVRRALAQPYAVRAMRDIVQ